MLLIRVLVNDIDVQTRTLTTPARPGWWRGRGSSSGPLRRRWRGSPSGLRGIRMCWNKNTNDSSAQGYCCAFWGSWWRQAQHWSDLRVCSRGHHLQPGSGLIILEDFKKRDIDERGSLLILIFHSVWLESSWRQLPLLCQGDQGKV